MSRSYLSAIGIARLQNRRQRGAGQGHPDRQFRGSPMRTMLSAFPLFIIPVGIYSLIALATGGDPVTLAMGETVLTDRGSPMMGVLGGKFLIVPMLGGSTDWVLTKGDALLLLSIGVLFLEILKSTSTHTASIMNHAFSMLIFIGCLIAFLLHPNFATAVFFIITIMALLDVLAGVVVTIIAARRDFALSEG